MMQQLAQSEDLGIVIPHLKAIAKHVLDASLMRCNLVAEEASLPKSEKKLNELLGSIKNSHSNVTEYKVHFPGARRKNTHSSLGWWLLSAYSK